MKHLFNALADLIEDRVRDRKLRWLIAIPSGITTLLVVVGFTASIPPLVNVSLLSLCLFLFIVVTVLSINRRYMRREIGRASQVLRVYGDRIRRAQEANRDLFHTTAWTESVAISSKGDATIIRDITVRIGDEPIAAIWSLSSRNSDSHLSATVRDAVRVNACYLKDDDVEGTSIVTTMSWEGGNKLRTYMHFDRDVAPGEVVKLRITIRWPKYSADILDGNIEVNSWIFRRPTDSFESAVRFEQSFSSKPLRVTTLSGSPVPQVTPEPASRQTKIHLRLEQIEVDREYGYRIDLDPSSHV